MAVTFVPLNIETSNFQEMFSYLYTAVHIEKTLDSVLLLEWECYENDKNLFVSVRAPDFGILFCPFGFLLELSFPANNKPCTHTSYKYRKV